MEKADSSAIADRLAVVRERVAASAGGRRVTIVGVTKRFGAEWVLAGLQAGLSDFGENYAQELAGKAAEVRDEVGDAAGVRWHMIGAVQTNKVKRLVDAAPVFQTVDRESVVDEIAKRCPSATVFIQVNTTGEDSKSGVGPEGARALADRAVAAGLDLRGLMTIGPTDQSIDPRPAFARCRTLVDELGLAECSMGMSADYEAAIEEGSTLVRIGTALFGPRTVGNR